MTKSRYEKSLNRLLTSESTPKLGLARITSLLKALGNPERSFDIFHIAGTNGKGSTCAFLASLLQKSNRSVGLYTSPHLSSARERIQINRTLIEEEEFSEAEDAVFGAAARINEHPTFFERITAMAFWTFAQRKVDAAVVEVGLGGRLDATNVVLPLVSVISRIDLDHTDILGDSIESIAFEKAGIIKPNTPVVTGWQDANALETISRVANERNAPLTLVSTACSFDLGLKGHHQKYNAALAVAAMTAAKVRLPDAAVAEALRITTWPGRFELVQQNPPIILDGAHNASGMRALLMALEEKPWSKKSLTFVVGGTNGHDQLAMSNAIRPLSTRIRLVIATKSKSPRALKPEELQSIHRELAPCIVSANVDHALKAAEESASEDTLIVVCGSLFVVGEARAHFVNVAQDPEFPMY